MVDAGDSPIDFTEEISKEKRKRELLALHLRLIQGVNLLEIGTLEAGMLTVVRYKDFMLSSILNKKP